MKKYTQLAEQERLRFNLQVQHIHGECVYEQLLPSKPRRTCIDYD
jgi:hypothetical protein